jgi:hypothetical protein
VIKLIIQWYNKKHPGALHQLEGNKNIGIELTEEEVGTKVPNWRDFSELRRLGELAFDKLLQRLYEFNCKTSGGAGLLLKESRLSDDIGFSSKYHEFLQQILNKCKRGPVKMQIFALNLRKCARWRVRYNLYVVKKSC